MTTTLSTTPVLRAAVAEDRDALAQMLSGLSPYSSFQRFFTGGFRATDQTLDVLLCVTRAGRAFVAVDGGRVLAHVMWARTGHDTPRAEIGVVVAADQRGQGLATRLTRLTLADAAKRGMVQVEATVLAGNRAAHHVVQKVLPHAASTTSQGEVQYVASLGLRPAVWRRVGLSHPYRGRTRP